MLIGRQKFGLMLLELLRIRNNFLIPFHKEIKRLVTSVLHTTKILLRFEIYYIIVFNFVDVIIALTCTFITQSFFKVKM